jgi:hypothetical protein
MPWSVLVRSAILVSCLDKQPKASTHCTLSQLPRPSQSVIMKLLVGIAVAFKAPGTEKSSSHISLSHHLIFILVV